MKKKILAAILSAMMVMSVGAVSVSAAETEVSPLNEVCYATNEVTGETVSNQTRGRINNSEFTHNYRMRTRTRPGASDWADERAECETTYKGYNKTRYDSYSRARMEKGSSIKVDSGRQYDSKDGNKDGESSARSGWYELEEGYTGHTYYGY